jgi:glycosyltransferase involved in cell wall biosynthesis
MFCSTIIPTIGRVDLDRAVSSVLAQDYSYSESEIIVVNDSGKQLPSASWHDRDNVTIIDTDRRERSVARNTGAAVARGEFLHFLDDDDWLLPGAHARICALARKTEAAWIYGLTQLVDRSGEPLIVLDQGLAGNCFTPLMAGEWIPLQSSWIRTEAFFGVGGFNTRITGPEDIDLARRIALEYEFAPLIHIVANVAMGEVGSSTPWERHSPQSRWARESILDKPQTYDRLRSSAVDACWRGRIGRTYATSAAWNLQHRQPLRAASRLGMAMRSAIATGPYLLDKAYWKALVKPYASFAFAAGERARMS